MDIKNEVLYRVYFLLFAVFMPIAGLLVYGTINIAVVEGERWRGQGEANYVDERTIEPERGNIFAADGSLLATSVPYFDLYFDPFAASQEDYEKYMDTLAHCMATYVDPTYTVGGYVEYLKQLRDTTNGKRRNVLIKKGVAFEEKYRIEQFPLFNLGQFRGGLIARKASERKRPFGLLARRTIGYNRADNRPIGLEGSFDEVLRGEPGSQFMIKVDPRNDLWIPMEDLTVVEPRSGDDIVTTLDVNLQDIASDALLRAMQSHEAEWGTAVLMDVKTGAIKAIANLGRDESSGGYYEMYNYAIAMATEPGSTFKAASMMALLEDKYVKLTDSVSIEYGATQYYKQEMVDASPLSKNFDSITVRQAFEISSNVGISKLVNRYYGAKTEENDNQGAARYVERLRSYNLHLPTGIELEGEAEPYIKEAYSQQDNWSGTTLPWMAIGYETRITPLQILTFYNGIANNGALMKPYLVSAVQRNGEPVTQYRPTVVKERMASREVIQQMRLLLEGVVQRGTAQKLSSDRYRFAGKTGTAQIDYRRGARGTLVGGYQASFVGYFPAENPVYSCIVVINKPRNGAFYGSDVAGPVFREIADKVYNTMINVHEPINRGPRPVLYARNLPRDEVGYRADFSQIMNYLQLPLYAQGKSEMGLLTAHADSLLLQPRRMPERVAPNVIGMGLRDAVYAFENRGFKVRSTGVGKVARQSLMPGTRSRGQTVVLYLN